jgi:hypothetical protein
LRKFSSKDSSSASTVASNCSSANAPIPSPNSSIVTSQSQQPIGNDANRDGPSLPPSLPVDCQATDAENERIVSESAVQLNKVDERLQTLDNQCKAISRLGKRLADCTLTLSRYQNKLSDELAGGTLCQHHSEKLRNLLQDWRTFDVRCSRAADQRAALLMRTLLEPVKRLRSALVQLKQATRQQQRAHAQLDKCKGKLTRAAERERSAGNLLRLHETRQQWRRLCTDCAAGSERVLSEVNALADARVQYLQPAFEALVKAELLLWADALRAFTIDQPVLSAPSSLSASSSAAAHGTSGVTCASTGTCDSNRRVAGSMAALLSVTAAAAARSSSPALSDQETTWSPKRHSIISDDSAKDDVDSCDFSMFQVKRLDWTNHGRLQRNRLDAIAQLSIVEGVQ